MSVGVNAIGDFSAVHGLAEAARRVVEALVHAGVEVSLVDVASGAPRDAARRGPLIDGLPQGRRHPIDLVLLNVNELINLADDERATYVIGLWYWELLEFEPPHIESYARVDEVWAAADFVANTFKALGTKPVSIISAVIDVPEPPRLDSDTFVRPDGLVVLFTFDANSSVARKNPFGCVEAFKRAFSESERGTRAHLVVKALSSENYPGLLEELAQAVASVKGTLISESLPRSQMDALLDSCDVYLSMHRSEGFGLGMAEAMGLGKAVVATAFGGNTSFMTAESACLVGFRMRRIVAEDHDMQPAYRDVYRPGQAWAEPDVEQAASWLRLLADRSDLRAELGRRAVQRIDEVASSQAVGAAMRQRLEAIGAGLKVGALDS